MPSVTPTASFVPSPIASEVVVPPSTTSFVGKVVTTIADDGLRVRTQPRVSDDSFRLKPLLPAGSQSLVIGGPVVASGYAWHEVVPLSSRAHPSGWIASAGRDGQPWIRTDAFDCPSVPRDMRSLAALPAGVGLHCFAGVPITVEARLLSCHCDVDGLSYTPTWFFLGSGSPTLLVPPDVTTKPSQGADWFVLHLDPDGRHPDPVPIGQVVELTGIFDHPAAADCIRTQMEGDPLPSQGCRLAFAVTRLVATGP